MTVGYLIFCVTLSTILGYNRPDWMVVEVHLVLSALMSFCLLPTWRWVMHKQRAAIPFAPGIGLFYFFWFGYAAYSDAELYATVSVSDLSTETALLILAAVLSMAIGWRLALIGRQPPNLSDGESEDPSTLARAWDNGTQIDKLGTLMLAGFVVARVTGLFYELTW